MNGWQLPGGELGPMVQAHGVACTSLGLTAPNPAVGCVLWKDGAPIGIGSTRRAGGRHAEIEALQDAAARGHDSHGATAYVTLEPCSHHGRTPPCCDALVEAGISHAIVAQQDPNPLVSGNGIDRLRQAGIEVTLLSPDDPIALESRALNIGFFSRMIRKTPWVRLKVAATLDGKTALDDGTSQWITGEAARADGHAWRYRSSAILTGIGTVLQDDPRLDVRLVPAARQPDIALVDSRLQLPATARLFMPGRRLWIYTAVEDPARHAPLQDLGATVIPLPGPTGKVDLAAMMRDLAVREVNELHVEAGTKLNGSLIREGLVDEFLVYLAPKLLGQGMGLAEFGPLASLADAVPLQFTSVDRVGDDLRVLARIPGRDSF